MLTLKAPPQPALLPHIAPPPSIIYLKEGENRFGREPPHEGAGLVVVFDDPHLPNRFVSRYQARIDRHGDEYVLHAQGINGMIVNNVKVQSATLKNNDVIVFGGVPPNAPLGTMVSRPRSTLMYVFTHPAEAPSSALGGGDIATNSGGVASGLQLGRALAAPVTAPAPPPPLSEIATPLAPLSFFQSPPPPLLPPPPPLQQQQQLQQQLLRQQHLQQPRHIAESQDFANTPLFSLDHDDGESLPPSPTEARNLPLLPGAALSALTNTDGPVATSTHIPASSSPFIPEGAPAAHPHFAPTLAPGLPSHLTPSDSFNPPLGGGAADAHTASSIGMEGRTLSAILTVPAPSILSAAAMAVTVTNTYPLSQHTQEIVTATTISPPPPTAHPSLNPSGMVSSTTPSLPLRVSTSSSSALNSLPSSSPISTMLSSPASSPADAFPIPASLLSPSTILFPQLAPRFPPPLLPPKSIPPPLFSSAPVTTATLTSLSSAPSLSTSSSSSSSSSSTSSSSYILNPAATVTATSTATATTTAATATTTLSSSSSVTSPPTSLAALHPHPFSLNPSAPSPIPLTSSPFPSTVFHTPPKCTAYNPSASLMPPPTCPLPSNVPPSLLPFSPLHSTHAPDPAASPIPLALPPASTSTSLHSSSYRPVIQHAPALTTTPVISSVSDVQHPIDTVAPFPSAMLSSNLPTSTSASTTAPATAPSVSPPTNLTKPLPNIFTTATVLSAAPISSILTVNSSDILPPSSPGSPLIWGSTLPPPPPQPNSAASAATASNFPTSPPPASVPMTSSPSTVKFSPPKLVSRVSGSGSGSLSQVRQELTCTICEFVMLDARTLSCGHSFCEFCINQCRGTNTKFPCPICRKQITKGPIRVVSLLNIIEAMVPTLLSEEEQESRATRARDVQREAQKQAAASVKSTTAAPTPPPQPPRAAVTNHPARFAPAAAGGASAPAFGGAALVRAPGPATVANLYRQRVADATAAAAAALAAATMAARSEGDWRNAPTAARKSTLRVAPQPAELPARGAPMLSTTLPPAHLVAFSSAPTSAPTTSAAVAHSPPQPAIRHAPAGIPQPFTSTSVHPPAHVSAPKAKAGGSIALVRKNAPTASPPPTSSFAAPLDPATKGLLPMSRSVPIPPSAAVAAAAAAVAAYSAPVVPPATSMAVQGAGVKRRTVDVIILDDDDEVVEQQEEMGEEGDAGEEGDEWEDDTESRWRPGQGPSKKHRGVL